MDLTKNLIPTTYLTFRVLDIDSWYRNSYEYDVISCLNVLDRCDKPITLLNQMKSKLKPKTGMIILAMVLPLYQYVESGKNYLPFVFLYFALRLS